MEKIEFTSYLVIGSGRLASHLEFYLQSLNLPFKKWSRHEPTSLAAKAAGCSHVLLAISDRAIGDVGTRPELAGRIKVHFSGALTVPGICGAHPLMTFTKQLEAAEWYKTIPFILDEGTSMAKVLPGLPNPSFALAAQYRPLYHALCSLAGNFPFLLWQRIGLQFEDTLHLPSELLAPFLHQVVTNWTRDPSHGLTGPLARQDWDTILAHLEALKLKPQLVQAYQTYLGLAQAAGLPVPEVLS